MKQLIKNIAYGISNLWSWRKIIWKDRDWDYAFLCTIMIHKLKRMEKCIENGYAENSKRTSLKIKCCRMRLERVLEDDYCKDLLDEFTDKYGIESFSFISTDNDSSILKCNYSKCSSDEEMENASLEKLKIYELQSKKKQDDIRKAGRSLGKWLQYWWD